MIQQAPVSVVIPCYRCAATITAAVASVAGQSLRPAEVILVDDCSNDTTAVTLQAVKQSFPSRWIVVITLPVNRGPSVARNTGWEHATQPYLAFLDADDTWHPDKLRIQYQLMVDHPELVLTGHDVAIVDAPPNAEPTRTITLHAGSPSWRGLTPQELLAGNPFVTPSVLLLRDLTQRFNPQLRYCEDFMLWLEIGLDGGQVAIIDEPLVFVRRPADHTGLSRNEFRMRLGFARAYVELWRTGRIPFAMAARRSGELYAKAVLFRVLGPALHQRAKTKIQG